MTPQTLGVLTVSQFCEVVGISRSTWHKLKRQGKTPAIVNIGGIQRIRREAIETWLSENENADTEQLMTLPTGELCPKVGDGVIRRHFEVA